MGEGRTSVKTGTTVHFAPAALTDQALLQLVKIRGPCLAESRVQQTSRSVNSLVECTAHPERQYRLYPQG